MVSRSPPNSYACYSLPWPSPTGSMAPSWAGSSGCTRTRPPISRCSTTRPGKWNAMPGLAAAQRTAVEEYEAVRGLVLEPFRVLAGRALPRYRPRRLRCGSMDGGGGLPPARARLLGRGRAGGYRAVRAPKLAVARPAQVYRAGTRLPVQLADQLHAAEPGDVENALRLQLPLTPRLQRADEQFLVTTPPSWARRGLLPVTGRRRAR
jgi:hypothetical protein